MLTCTIQPSITGKKRPLAASHASAVVIEPLGPKRGSGPWKEAGVMTCKAALVHTSPGERSPVTWTDTLLLKKQNGAWRVDDIVYGGSWDFGPKGRLTDILKHVAAYKP